MITPSNELVNKVQQEFNLNLRNIFRNISIHLNRRRRYNLSIPVWINGSWIDTRSLYMYKAPIGKYFKPEFMISEGANPEKDDLTKQYTIMYRIYDKEHKIIISKGFCETVNDMLHVYMILLNDAYNLKKLLTGN